MSSTKVVSFLWSFILCIVSHSLDFHCAYSDLNSYKILPSQNIANISVISNDQIQISFDIEIKSHCNISSCNIVDISTNNFTHTISISIDGIANYIDITANNIDNYPMKYSIGNADKLLSIGPDPHHIYILFNQTTVLFHIDEKFEFKASPIIPFAFPNQLHHVFMSGPLYTASDAVIFNICINSLIQGRLQCGDIIQSQFFDDRHEIYYNLQINDSPITIKTVDYSLGYVDFFLFDTNGSILLESDMLNGKTLITSPWVLNGLYLLKIHGSSVEWAIQLECGDDNINIDTINDTIYCNDTIHGIATKPFTHRYYLIITHDHTPVFVNTCGQDFYAHHRNIRGLYLYGKEFELLSSGFPGHCGLLQLFISDLMVGEYIIEINFGISHNTSWKMDVLCDDDAQHSTNISIHIGNDTDDWSSCVHHWPYIISVLSPCNDSIVSAAMPCQLNLTQTVKYLEFQINNGDFLCRGLNLHLRDSNNAVHFSYNNSNRYINSRCPGSIKIPIHSLSPDQYTLNIVSFVDSFLAWSFDIKCCNNSIYTEKYTNIIEIAKYNNLPSWTWQVLGLVCEEYYGTTLATVKTNQDWHCVWEELNSNFVSFRQYLFIGMHRDLISGNKWYWIDDTECDYMPDNRCLQHYYWSAEGNVSVSQLQLGTYVLYESDVIRKKTSVWLESFDTENIFELNEEHPYSEYGIICSTPESEYQPQHCTDKNNCWILTDCCNDTRLIDDTALDIRYFAPSIAYWNDTLVVIGFNEIHYSTFDIFANIFNWKHIIYNNQNYTQNYRQHLHTQWGKLLYIYAVLDSHDFFAKLICMNIGDPENIRHYNIVNIYHEDNSIWSEQTCMVANNDDIYFILVTDKALSVFKYNVNTETGEYPFYSNSYTLNGPVQCTLRYDMKFIYIFYDISSIISYHMVSNTIQLIQLPRFTEYPVLDVLTAPNNKLYIQGIYTTSWKTIVFDSENQMFEENTIDIDIPKHSNIPFYRHSKLSVMKDNILLLLHSTDHVYPKYSLSDTGSIYVYYTITESLSINFSKTISSKYVWPTDGVDIKYFVNDFAKNITKGIYNIWFNIDDRVNYNVSLDSSNCVCNGYTCIDCNTHLNLTNYMSSNTANFTLTFIPQHGYKFDVLLLPNKISILVQRCKISLSCDEDTNNNHPTIHINYSLSSNCYERTAKRFIINITSDTLNLFKHLTFGINDEGIATCHVCDVRGSCVYCTQHLFAVNFDPENVDIGKHLIHFDTNMNDIYLPNSIQTVTYSINKNNDTLRYLLFLLVLPMVIICVVYVYCKREYMKAYVVQKALVLIIGISQFEEKKLLLDGVGRNVSDLTKLWRDQYQYDVFICNEQELYSTKNDIIDFVDKYKRKLEYYKYDAVIVHVISHGANNGDSFLTSEQKKVDIDFIRHEVTDSLESISARDSFNIHNRSVVKVIFNHVCRGEHIYFKGQRGFGFLNTDDTTDETSNHRFVEDSNWAIIYGTIVNRALSDYGDFTDCICEVFGDNLRRIRKKNLRVLITEIGVKLEERTHAAEICNTSESFREETIRFEMFDNHYKQNSKNIEINDGYRKLSDGEEYYETVTELQQLHISE
eukprot:258393_1